MEKHKVVLGVIGTDVHAVGNKIMDFAFTNAGFDVVNLGVMVSQEEFIEAAIESNAKAILVSSLNGHGELDCNGLREKCNEAGLKGIKLYTGGNLVIGKVDHDEIISRFKAMGYDGVYPSTIPIEVAIKDIKAELGVA